MLKSKVKFSSAVDRIDDRLRPREAAEIAHVSVGTINNWWQAGYFESWVVPTRGLERGVRYVDAKSFLSFLDSQREVVSK